MTGDDLDYQEATISLEESCPHQKGMKPVQSCKEKIDTVEKKILIMNGDGGLDEF